MSYWHLDNAVNALRVTALPPRAVVGTYTFSHMFSVNGCYIIDLFAHYCC